jgi:hypothetical protein
MSIISLIVSTHAILRTKNRDLVQEAVCLQHPINRQRNSQTGGRLASAPYQQKQRFGIREAVYLQHPVSHVRMLITVAVYGGSSV